LDSAAALTSKGGMLRSNDGACGDPENGKFR
jgi:hypothetical protein